MYRTVAGVIAAAVVAALFTPARAAVLSDPFLAITAPATYTPGTAFDIDLRLHAALDLNAFNIVLAFTAPAGAYGTDYSVTLPAANPALQPDYIFGAAGMGFLASETAPNSGHIALSDLLLNPVGSINTVSPGQDLIVRLTIQPVGSFAAPITVSALPTNLDLLDPTLSQIAGYQNVLDTLPTATIAAVPEPASLLLLGVAATGLLMRRKP
jgi:hypothetical protein